MAFKFSKKPLFKAHPQTVWYHIFFTTKPVNTLDEVLKLKHDTDHAESINEAREKAIRGIEMNNAMGNRFPFAFIFKGSERIPVGVVYFQNHQAYYLNPNFEYTLNSNGSISNPVRRNSSIWC